MDINEFLNSFGFTIGYVIIFVIIFIGLAFDVYQLNNGNGNILMIGGKILMLTLFTIIFVFFKSSEELRNEFFQNVRNFWNFIDWNFWGYYILFPVIGTSLLITIIKAIKAKP